MYKFIGFIFMAFPIFSEPLIDSFHLGVLSGYLKSDSSKIDKKPLKNSDRGF